VVLIGLERWELFPHDVDVADVVSEYVAALSWPPGDPDVL
jgi:hypothetical protein